jgi:hypothetical protein
MQAEGMRSSARLGSKAVAPPDSDMSVASLGYASAQAARALITAAERLQR